MRGQFYQCNLKVRGDNIVELKIFNEQYSIFFN